MSAEVRRLVFGVAVLLLLTLAIAKQNRAGSSLDAARLQTGTASLSEVPAARTVAEFEAVDADSLPAHQFPRVRAVAQPNVLCATLPALPDCRCQLRLRHELLRSLGANALPVSGSPTLQMLGILLRA